MEPSILMVPVPEWRIHHPDFARFSVDNWGLVATAVACDGGPITAMDGWLCEGSLVMGVVRARILDNDVRVTFREQDCLERDRFERAATAWTSRLARCEESRLLLQQYAMISFLSAIVDRSAAYFAPYAVVQSYGLEDARW